MSSRVWHAVIWRARMAGCMTTCWIDGIDTIRIKITLLTTSFDAEYLPIFIYNIFQNKYVTSQVVIPFKWFYCIIWKNWNILITFWPVERNVIQCHYQQRLISNTSPPHHRHKVCNKNKETSYIRFSTFFALVQVTTQPHHNTTAATIAIPITLHIANQSQYFIRNDILFASLVKRWIVLQQQRIVRKWIHTQPAKNWIFISDALFLQRLSNKLHWEKL